MKMIVKIQRPLQAVINEKALEYLIYSEDKSINLTMTHEQIGRLFTGSESKLYMYINYAEENKTVTIESFAPEQEW